MQQRPHIKLERSTTDKIMEMAGWLLLVLLWALVIVTYLGLPDTIPTHYNTAGKPDNYGRKTSYLLLPVVGTILFVGMTLLNRYPWIFNYISFSKENALQQYADATKMIRFLKTAIVFVFLLISLFTWSTATGRSAGLGRWFLPFTLALFLVPSFLYVMKALRSVKGR